VEGTPTAGVEMVVPHVVITAIRSGETNGCRADRDGGRGTGIDRLHRIPIGVVGRHAGRSQCGKQGDGEEFGQHRFHHSLETMKRTDVFNGKSELLRP
jgi:hypothetical protein